MSLLTLLFVVPNAIYWALPASAWSTFGIADDAIAVAFGILPILAGFAVWVLRRHAPVTGSRRVGEALLGAVFISFPTLLFGLALSLHP
jgi:uncharacterized membrane protein